ncbi:hypothetical protein F7725_009843 [Dissostichus mawsoni]|uniref:Tyrosine-protein kinase n=1 Tax=Dissostichus mawsoni TaxID=36200 RepID=A0A7J5XLV7_DISMA|nr:hypothetical protein F7725_009843 [Dissostichus mawsoni]
MFPRVILNGTMIKKSQQKKRTSPCNYKERFFVLDTQELKYSESRHGKKPLQKGCIELSRIKCVEIVCSDSPIPCNYKYPFQVFHNNHYLYVFAPDNDCRQRWRQSITVWLKNTTQTSGWRENGNAANKQKNWRQVVMRMTHGVLYCQTGLHDADQRMVFALQDYTPVRNDELFLQKDQAYTLINSSTSKWWAVQDGRGNTGFVPSNYLAEKTGNNFQRFEWYNKNMTRGEAETLLVKQGKEGAFMVRDSSHVGVYTVSVFTKAPGSNAEKTPRVIHYHIRQTERGEAAFYLAENYLFTTIPELIHYHQHNAAGLITRLRHPVSQDGSCSPDIVDLSKGVFMWEVYNEGRLPYDNRSNVEVVESLNMGLRLMKPRLAPDAVHLLMEWCWKEKPEDRPSFALLVHELASV